MKKISLSLLSLTLIISACKNDGEEQLLAKKWQAIELQNPDLDSIIREQSAFLDTVGSHTTAEENEKIYGFKDVDSAKVALKAQLDDYKAMQQHAVENTKFEFMTNGMVKMNFSGQEDSASWYYDDDGDLIIDEMKLKGAGSKIRMKVLELDNDHMKLKFEEENMRSTVTFKALKD